MRVLKTIIFFFCFLFSASPISAQQTSIPVKIESPTSNIVPRSFTITGTAQAGAKLHLSINGKTFGRYRATIDGKFTIGVSVPEDQLFIELDHLVEGKIESTDSLRLQIGAEKTIEKIKASKETKETTRELESGNEDEKGIEVEPLTKPDETRPNLPSATKIPAKPQTLKRQYDGLTSDAKGIEENQRTEKDPVILKRKPKPSLQNQNWAENSSMGGRIAVEAIGAIAITALTIGLSFFVADFGRSAGSTDLFLALVAAQIGLAPLGVYFGGELMGGNGQLWAVYVGEVVGLLGSFVFLSGITSSHSESATALVLLAIASPFVGMIGGYEISHALSDKRQDIISIQPTLQLSKEVKGVGLRLSF